MQRGDLVVQRPVAFVQRGTLQGADGSGVALQLQQLTLKTFALAQDVGGRAQGFGGLAAGVGEVFHHWCDASKGAAELHQHGKVFAAGLSVEVLRLHQLAVGIAGSGQGQAQAAQGLSELLGGLGGALCFGEKLGVIASRRLREVLQAAEGVRQLAGQVCARQAGGVKI